MECHNAYYLIESAHMVDMVKAYIADFERANAVNAELCREIGGVKACWLDQTSKAIYAVKFEGKHHPDFTKPRATGFSRPKKGSAWAKRFAENKGIEYPDVYRINDLFNVPFSLSYKTDDGEGSMLIGYFPKPAGFLFASEDGPLGLYIPDVARYVTSFEKRGIEVDPDVKSFDMNLEGCRRILKEEWELIAAKHELAQQQKGEV